MGALSPGLHCSDNTEPVWMLPCCGRVLKPAIFCGLLQSLWAAVLGFEDMWKAVTGSFLMTETQRHVSITAIAGKHLCGVMCSREQLPKAAPTLFIQKTEQGSLLLKVAGGSGLCFHPINISCIKKNRGSLFQSRISLLLSLCSPWLGVELQIWIFPGAFCYCSVDHPK